MDEIQYLKDHRRFAELVIKSESVQSSKFILKNFLCPGDLIMLSACIRDIKKWYPHIKIDVKTSCDEIWLNNPHLTALNASDPDVVEIDTHYDIIHQSNQNIDRHFIHGFIDDFNRQTGYAVKLTDFKGDLHLTEEEITKPVFEDQPDDFVVLVAGGKTDYMTKWWWPQAWKKVLDLCPDIQFIQIGKRERRDPASKEGIDHIHTPIESKNCINKVDKTSIRDVMRLVYQSKGVLSVVTAMMHMAACFEKHAAVVAGGHEPWWWERYPGHDYFHTIGRLACCKDGGCWQGECENKNSSGHQKCLELIDPADVASAIKRWF